MYGCKSKYQFFTLFITFVDPQITLSRAVNKDSIVGGLWPGEGLQAESADWCRPNSSTSLGTRLRLRCDVTSG